MKLNFGLCVFFKSYLKLLKLLFVCLFVKSLGLLECLRDVAEHKHNYTKNLI